MNRKIIFSIVLAVTFIFASTACNIGVQNSNTPPNSPVTNTVPDSHYYFPEESEFTYRIISANQEQDSIIQAKYKSQETNSSDKYHPQTVYHFNTIDTESQVNLWIPSEIAEIKLTPEMEYQIISQIQPGWPFSYGLIIAQGGNIVFLGISDGQHITIDDRFLPELFPTLKIEQTRVLTDHYIENINQFIRLTNTEIKFSLGDSSVTSHQGESARLGDFQINLRIARKAEYKQGYYDAGVNGLSYTISRVTDIISPTTNILANEKVYFPDPSLNALIHKIIRLQNGDIYKYMLKGITTLDASKQGISNLNGLENCIELKSLNLFENRITDVTALTNLSNLTFLNLDQNQISNINPLSGLKNLNELHLMNNQVIDVSAISNLTGLRVLDLSDNKISNINPLSKVTNLVNLNLNKNQINEVTALTGLVNLKYLYLSWNKISNITPLSGLINLENLQSGVNQISDISAAANLSNLTNLTLTMNSISDISALSNLTKLKFLDISRNGITNIDVLVKLKNIVHMSLSENQIVDITSLVKNEGLDNGDNLTLRGNPLNGTSINVFIPQLRQRGVKISWESSLEFN
jgi:Leucine-rich repeat (LRR) protein